MRENLQMIENCGFGEVLEVYGFPFGKGRTCDCQTAITALHWGVMGSVGILLHTEVNCLQSELFFEITRV